MRQRARVDNNQKQITDEIRKQDGFCVEITSQLGRGFPDIIVGYKKKIAVLVEIKDPSKPWKLTPDEIKFKEKTQCPYLVAETSEEIIDYIFRKLAEM